MLPVKNTANLTLSFVFSSELKPISYFLVHLPMAMPRTRHVFGYVQGLILTALAIHGDLPSIMSQWTTWIPTIISMFDWFVATIQKYKGVYVEGSQLPLDQLVERLKSQFVITTK